MKNPRRWRARARAMGISRAAIRHAAQQVRSMNHRWCRAVVTLGRRSIGIYYESRP